MFSQFVISTVRRTPVSRDRRRFRETGERPVPCLVSGSLHDFPPSAPPSFTVRPVWDVGGEDPRRTKVRVQSGIIFLTPFKTSFERRGLSVSLEETTTH